MPKAVVFVNKGLAEAYNIDINNTTTTLLFGATMRFNDDELFYPFGSPEDIEETDFYRELDENPEYVRMVVEDDTGL